MYIQEPAKIVERKTNTEYYLFPLRESCFTINTFYNFFHNNNYLVYLLKKNKLTRILRIYFPLLYFLITPSLFILSLTQVYNNRYLYVIDIFHFYFCIRKISVLSFLFISSFFFLFLIYSFLFPLLLLHFSAKVSWVRHRDIHILTAGTYTYTSDQRFQALHQKLPPGTYSEWSEWTLCIKWVQERDQGVYECQISTIPVKAQQFQLNVVGKYLFVFSEKKKHNEKKNKRQQTNK